MMLFVTSRMQRSLVGKVILAKYDNLCSDTMSVANYKKQIKARVHLQRLSEGTIHLTKNYQTKQHNRGS